MLLKQLRRLKVQSDYIQIDNLFKTTAHLPYDEITVNSFMHSFSQSNQSGNCIKLINQSQNSTVTPLLIHYLIKSFISKDINQASAQFHHYFHQSTLSAHHIPLKETYYLLINAYRSLKDANSCKSLYLDMQSRIGVSGKVLSVLFDVYLESSRYTECLTLLKEFQPFANKNSNFYNQLLSLYVKTNNVEMLAKEFKRMDFIGLRPNSDTLNILLGASMHSVEQCDYILKGMIALFIHPNQITLELVVKCYLLNENTDNLIDVLGYFTGLTCQCSVLPSIPLLPYPVKLLDSTLVILKDYIKSNPNETKLCSFIEENFSKSLNPKPSQAFLSESRKDLIENRFSLTEEDTNIQQVLTQFISSLSTRNPSLASFEDLFQSIASYTISTPLVLSNPTNHITPNTIDHLSPCSFIASIDPKHKALCQLYNLYQDYYPHLHLPTSPEFESMFELYSPHSQTPFEILIDHLLSHGRIVESSFILKRMLQLHLRPQTRLFDRFFENACRNGGWGSGFMTYKRMFRLGVRGDVIESEVLMILIRLYVLGDFEGIGCDSLIQELWTHVYRVKKDGFNLKEGEDVYEGVYKVLGIKVNERKRVDGSKWVVLSKIDDQLFGDFVELMLRVCLLNGNQDLRKMVVLDMNALCVSV